MIRKQDTGEPGNGGEFGRHARPDAEVTLGRSGASRTDIASWLALNQLRLPESALGALTERINAAPTDSTLVRVDAYREVHQAALGFAAEDAEQVNAFMVQKARAGDDEGAGALRRVLNAAYDRPVIIQTTPGDGSFERPVDVSDPRIQAGAVFDTIIDGEGTVLHRVRPGVAPCEPNTIRIQASETMSATDIAQLSDLIEYGLAANVRRTNVRCTLTDSPYSITVDVDASESTLFSEEASERHRRFIESFPELAAEGSPIRTTDRKGPGTAGTRAIAGLSKANMKFEFFYDSVDGE